LFFAGCAPQPEAPVVDLASERAALTAADQAWSQTVPDVEKFVAFFAEGATFLPPDGPITEGLDAIHSVASGLFSSPGFNLTWKATKAEVSSSADMGYTIGTYQLTMNDAAGQPATSDGKYLTVWQKQADGQWKVVADSPSASAPPAAAQ
jgi:ketosteroid isomerase-like protein